MVTQSNNGHDSDDVYTTAKGRKIRFVGVNPTLIDQLQNAGTLPSVPFRLMETDLGQPQKDELTADSLQNDQEKAEWAEYVEKRDAILKLRNDNFIRAIFFHGVDVDDATIDEWKQEQVEVWGLEVPKNRVDLKVSYVNSEFIGNADDLVNVITGVLGKSGVPEEAMSDVRQMFRSSVQANTSPEAETS